MCSENPMPLILEPGDLVQAEVQDRDISFQSNGTVRCIADGRVYVEFDWKPGVIYDFDAKEVVRVAQKPESE